jgi:hypothetical protein
MARSAAERMRVYRKRMKAAGFREVRLWIPDSRSPGFIRERLRESLFLSRSRQAREELDFLEAFQNENVDTLKR